MSGEPEHTRQGKKIIGNLSSMATTKPQAKSAEATRTSSRRITSAQPEPSSDASAPTPPARKYYARPYQPQKDYRTQMRSFVSGKSRHGFAATLERIGLSLKALVLLLLGQPARGRGKGRHAGTTRCRLPQPSNPDRQRGPAIWVVLLVSILILFGNGVTQSRAWPTQPIHPRGFSQQSRIWQANPLDLPGMFRQAVGGVGNIVISNWPGNGSGESTPVEVAPQAMHPSGNYDLRAAPSLNAQQIDQILASYNSPATGTGQAWVALGQQYGIDPAFAIAFFIHESSAGTNPNWAGMKPGGATTHNVGNIICAGYSTCYGRFRDYPSWETGIEDWYRLISVEYIQGRGTVTVEQIIPIYAPSFENNVDGYIGAVTRLVDTWRTNGVTP